MGCVMICKGSQKEGKIYKGGTKIGKAYKGSRLVYSSGPKRIQIYAFDTLSCLIGEYSLNGFVCQIYGTTDVIVGMSGVLGQSGSSVVIQSGDMQPQRTYYRYTFNINGVYMYDYFRTPGGGMDLGDHIFVIEGSHVGSKVVSMFHEAIIHPNSINSNQMTYTTTYNTLTVNRYPSDDKVWTEDGIY